MCARSRNYLRSSLQIASKVNTSGWAILSHDFLNAPQWSPGTRLKCRVASIGENKSPGDVSASIGGENRFAIIASNQIRRDRHTKSPGVSPAQDC